MFNADQVVIGCAGRQVGLLCIPMENVFEIISVGEARARGLKRYFTGKPCKHGHIAERRVANKGCVVCAVNDDARNKVKHAEVMRERARAYYWDNAEERREYRRAYGKANREVETAKNKEWFARNPEKIREYQKRDHEKRGPQKAEFARVWRKENRARANALGAKRYARQRSAIPYVREDLLPFYQSEMLAIYAESRTVSELTGVRHDVDHIFPISKGGVHAPWNLRVLLSSENQSKKDKWPKHEPTHVMWQGELMSRLIETTE